MYWVLIKKESFDNSSIEDTLEIEWSRTPLVDTYDGRQKNKLVGNLSEQ